MKLKYHKFIPINFNTFESYKGFSTLNYNNLSFTFFNQEIYYNNDYNISKISFQIQVSDSNHNSIIPSDLTLYYNLRILCFIEVKKMVNIYSIASIKEDKYFKCIEFFYFYEEFKIGIIISHTSRSSIEKNYFIYNLKNSIFIKKYKYKGFFDCLEINKKYNYMISEIQNNRSIIPNKRLKKLFIVKPICSLKRYFAKNDNKWYFVNLFDEYFCFCKGFDCLKNSISHRCKYFFYIFLIDANKNVYKKTDFLLMDFILKKYSSDDAYPIFKEMINRKLSAHYLTENERIYEKYCHNKKYCSSIVYTKGLGYKINDDFLERYLSLILKLRQVISSAGFNINFINSLFYSIDYITYICIGHGVSYFKYYLYQQYYGPQNFDKLLIPNSEKLISVTLKNGWKDENLIKLNLPRWEKYNTKNKSLKEIRKIKSDSIFVMFTWREIKRGGKISSQYINNIKSLVNNAELNNNLIIHNLTLYFTLHHKLLKYKNKFNLKYNIKYIEENDIAECLSNTNLIITDFSSIIFDIIYRRKPYIIYIPDAYDPIIKKNYISRNYRIINNFKNNDFNFENIFFDINSTINKINYYIYNNFKLDSRLNKFYDEFNFTIGLAINNFINYIIKL